MRNLKLILTVLIAMSCSHCTTSGSKTREQSPSDIFAKDYTFDFAELFPEQASSLGFAEFDKLGTQPSIKTRLIYFEKLKQWETQLKNQIEMTSDPNTRLDLEILLEHTQLQLQNVRLEEKERIIQVGLPSQSVYRGLAQLANEQFPLERQKRAVDRFKHYMSSENKKSYVQDLKDRLEYDQKMWDGKLSPYSYPSAEYITKYLNNSDAFVSGVEELLTKTGRSDWKKDFERFQQEVSDYNEFLKSKVLPLAPKRTQLSREKYVLQLKRYGNYTDPDVMIREGRKAFQKDYLELKGLAKEISKKHNLKNSNPFYVTQFLKQSAVKDAHEAKELYLKADQRLQSLIQKHNLVSLPQKPLLIRLGNTAESKATPVPHLNIPPLINNKGERPEFVVPTGNEQTALPYDDFSHFGMAMALTAHEGRPGHDLQFQHILSQPISIIRAHYAFNSVNVEGWALYAEQIMVPYLTVEEQFSFLQSKMWRVARYFLDPMIHLGQANERFVIQVLHRQLGLSEALAKTEYERYSFRSPGQAPSYYQGLLNLLHFRESFHEQEGKMDIQCFHDTLLSLGLVPHEKLLRLKSKFSDCKL